jgi:hypothetical protein
MHELSLFGLLFLMVKMISVRCILDTARRSYREIAGYIWKDVLGVLDATSLSVIARYNYVRRSLRNCG